MRKLFILSILAMIAWGLGGCGGGGGTSSDPLGTDNLKFGHKDNPAGTEWSMAMQVAPKGTAVLTAKITNAGGKEVAGREVSFEFRANQSGATLNTLTVNTDAAGEATVIYTAGTVGGFDVVRAYISNGAMMDVNITVTGGGRQISLTGSPTSLAAGQNSILTATVTDSSGNIVVGQTVIFSFIVNQSGAPALTVLNAGLTDGAGRAVAIYRAGSATPNSAVQDTVQAAIVGICNTPLILTRTASTAAPSARIVALSAGTTSLAAGQSSILTAKVTDPTGNPVSGQVVAFQFLGGVAASGAILATLNGGTTDAGGQALAVYTAGANTPALSVQDTIQASVAGATGVVIITRTTSTAVPVGYRMALTADVTSLAAGRSAVVTATVTDGSGNPVSGQVVTFQFLGGVAAPSGATLATLNGGNTDSSGRAVAVYTAGATNPTTTVQDVVQASVVGSTMAIVITRTVAGGGAGFSITVDPSPTSIYAGEQSLIVATVMNADSTPAAGQVVMFGFVTNNSGAPAMTVMNATTNANGKATALYTAGSNSPGLKIQDTVSASVTGSVGAAIITRLAGTGTGKKLAFEAAPTSVAMGGNSILTATVTSESGSPVSNEPVTFSIITGPGTIKDAGGTPLTLTVNTDTSGKAWVIFTGGASGETVIQAYINGSSRALIITTL
jgi:protocatechuate 3,4-dioxygenase beta subunit